MTNPFININSVSISINKSSLLTDVAWKRNGRSTTDPKGNLIITFIKGEKYEYIDVPSSVLQKMLLAESIGKFFHDNIKDQYTAYKEL